MIDLVLLDQKSALSDYQKTLSKTLEHSANELDSLSFSVTATNIENIEERRQDFLELERRASELAQQVCTNRRKRLDALALSSRPARAKFGDLKRRSRQSNPRLHNRHDYLPTNVVRNRPPRDEHQRYPKYEQRPGPVLVNLAASHGICPCHCPRCGLSRNHPAALQEPVLRQREEEELLRHDGGTRIALEDG